MREGVPLLQVEKLITSTNKIRYMVVDRTGEPIEPVLRYIKFKDNSNSARNTLRAYCYHLRLFFEFLEQKGIDYRDCGIDDMAEFMRWLQNSYGDIKVSALTLQEPFRKANTVNIIISTVMSFYDYLMRHEDYSIQLSERLKKQILGSRRGFKDFLYHINKDKMFSTKILKLKVPKAQPKTVSKENIAKLMDSCFNLRDKFLIQLLWESGMRIGECLALWLEDFEIDARRIHIRDRGELPNLAEIKTVCSPRVIDVSCDLINVYMNYIADYHIDEVDTNHVFIKLSGKSKYQPMEYCDVVSLFLRLGKKTGINITPHMLRHTSLTELRKAGWKPEHLQKRAGHKSFQTTLSIYYHPTDEDIRKDWEQAEQRMKLKRRSKGDIEN